MQVIIDDGWEGTGKKGRTIGENVCVKDEWFTPVVWKDGSGFNFVRTEALCIYKKEPCKHQSRFIELEVCPKCATLLSDIPTILGIPKKNPIKEAKS